MLPLFLFVGVFLSFIHSGKFTTIKDLANMDKVLYFINNFLKNIKFTYEIEKDFILPFLDVKILRRENDGVIISIYRKKTFTGV